MAADAPNPAVGLGDERKGILTFTAGVWKNNPIAIQVLGICSALAVTTRLENSLVMGAAVVFVILMSNLLISVMRGAIPRRIRMIVEVAVIATFVILVDQFLKAFYWDMSKRLGAYVGLIITNCIIMGRAEAYALHERPHHSLIDGLANGLGYTMVLAAVGLVREVAGSGRILFGRSWVLLEIPGYEPNLVMKMAPGGFIALGLLVALFYALGLQKETEGES